MINCSQRKATPSRAIRSLVRRQNDMTNAASNTPSSANPITHQPDPIDYKGVLERVLTPQFLAEKQGYPAETMLMRAARAGDAELVQIIAPKSDRLARGGYNNADTVLGVAAAAGHTECVRILLAENAKEQCEASTGWNDGELRAIDYAIKNGHWDCVRLIAPFTDLNDRGSSSGRRREPLTEAARQGRLDMLEFLAPLMEIEKPVRYSSVEDKNWAEIAIEGAASGSDPAVVDCLKWLIKRPETRMARVVEDGGALFEAIAADRAQTALFLLRLFGAETEQRVCSGADNGRVEFHTPLAWAIEKSAEKTVEALLPRCEGALAKTNRYDHQNKKVSQALLAALKKAVNIEKWDKQNQGGLERAWKVVDAVGAQWALLSGAEGHVQDAGDSSLKWLSTASLSDSRWARFPRWRASLEARALSDEMSKNQRPSTLEGAAHPSPSGALGGDPKKSEPGQPAHKAPRL